MDSHKRILAVIYIAWGVFDIFLLFVIGFVVFNIVPYYVGGYEERIIEAIVSFVFICVTLIIIIPSIVGGIGLLYNKQWAFILLVIEGCLSLLSFPIGTALGVYTLWVYFKVQQEKGTTKQEPISERTN